VDPVGLIAPILWVAAVAIGAAAVFIYGRDEASLSVGAEISGGVGVGAGGEIGLTVGKEKESWMPKLRGHLSTCQNIGAVAYGGVGINISASNSAPSTGVTHTAGAVLSGAFMGGLSLSSTAEISNPSNVTVSGGVGLGGGVVAAPMICQNYNYCTSD